MVILEVVDMEDKTFEVHVKQPSFALACYIIENQSVFTDEKNPDAKGLAQLFKEIFDECVIGWRIPPEQNWNNGAKKNTLPSPVATAVIRQLINMSRGIAEVRIKTEKN